MKIKAGMRIGISSCLIGESVRYDGGHKRIRTIIDTLAPVAELLPTCPEVELGMGIPRPPLILVEGMPGELRMVTASGEGQDYTERMADLAAEVRTDRLAGISGCIFKARSPSCGVGDVPVFNPRGDIVRTNSFGLFSGIIQRMMPNLPVADENSLAMAADIRQFVERAFVFRAWIDNAIETDEQLNQFHRQVREHAAVRSASLAEELDQIAACVPDEGLTACFERYFALLMSGLKTPPIHAGRANSLHAKIERTCAAVRGAGLRGDDMQDCSLR
ncbi:MAG: DUF523 domain-containing protein [Acidiferrobacterales bacterium]|nr:DUF523 domain-containing protein [Acidiferrobacterales bacterium]